MGNNSWSPASSRKIDWLCISDFPNVWITTEKKIDGKYTLTELTSFEIKTPAHFYQYQSLLLETLDKYTTYYNKSYIKNV